ncbi:5-formyltetrahydrofolate cyclo-ligase [Acuticoccus sp. M5D2P5]|uniref:5-formyltetrahydrofolate cyclo-ligase n=1 Tax=Acuticoccus kalidii TaxID=2910977 RepID=UPI001F1B429F|nr:5-formyltetrahydrofolate cyclo-ligase [Acuticoccus kalidii]MCF3934897.1 5-formyltetrahydrofolate cyclo-ligase [Acuticoccus kalidii]
MPADENALRRYASPPCSAGEFDPLAVDPQQAIDVARWRRSERIRLRRERDALSPAARHAASAALAQHLHTLLAKRFDAGAGRILSVYWPMKGEPDLRALMAALHAAGVIIALPVVAERAAPLHFRRWSPGARMMRGVWNIPVPADTGETLTPDIVLAPLVGWDGAGYRLGYGGGYFDRTLAALAPRPFAIGVGFSAARLATIFPQPHDIPLDLVVTEAGIADTCAPSRRHSGPA